MKHTGNMASLRRRPAAALLVGLLAASLLATTGQVASGQAATRQVNPAERGSGRVAGAALGAAGAFGGPADPCKTVRVSIVDLPQGAKAGVVLAGPSGYRHAFPSSGSVCLAPGAYTLIANPITFRNPLGQRWHAYPTSADGALPVERSAFRVPSLLTPLPLALTVSYFDQAPLTTFVLPRDLVLVPHGLVLPRFGALQVRRTSLTATIRPGDVVVSPVGPGLPHGLLGTVTTARRGRSALSLSTVAASPIRAFSQGRLTVTQKRPTPEVQSLDGLGVASDPAREARQHVVPAQSPSLGCGQDFTVSGSASFQPSASLNLGWSWGPWYAPWQAEINGSFLLDPGVSGQLTVAANEGVHCEVSVELATVPIGSYCTEFGCFTFNLLATASLGGTVGEAFSQTMSEQLAGGVGGSFDFGYSGSGLTPTDTLALTGSSTPATSAWQGSVGVGIGPSLQVLYGIPDVAGVGPQVGVEDQATLNASSSGWDAQGGVAASLGIGMSALGFSYSDSLGIPLGSVTIVPETSWPVIAPSAPLDVVATPNPANPQREVDVSWQPPVSGGTCGVSGYSVTAQPTGSSASVSASSTSATITGLSPDTTYTITVVADTSSCGTSQATASVTTPTAPPGPPSLTSVTSAQGWGRPGGWATFQAPSPCTGCAAVTGYVINWSGDGTTGTDSIPGSPDGFLLPAYGTPYTVTVSATSSAGTGAASNPVTFTPQSTPTAPVDVTVTAGQITSGSYSGPAATLTWAPPASDGGLSITSYEISWTGGQPTQPASAGTTATIRLPAYGVAYSFCVVAFNSLGNGPASPCLSATAVTLPTAPVGTTATSGTDDTVDAAWGPPGSDGGTPITGYQVDWAGDGTWGEEPASGTTASVHLPATGAYQVAVLATNAAGEGPPSSPVCVTVGASAPCAPTVTSVSAGGIPPVATVSWSPPADTGSSPVSSYTVTWTGPSQASSGSLTQPASAGTTASFKVVLGQYSVTVSATNSVGTGPPSPAATFTVVGHHPSPTLPPTPR